MYKLSIVIGVLNQFDITKRTIELLAKNADNPENIQLVIIDNGSLLHYEPELHGNRELLGQFGSVTLKRHHTNKGCYPVIFEDGLNLSDSPIVAFLHSDLFIVHKGYDSAILAQFDANENLGLAGVIGSTEIDNFGGRGMGTHSNFQGRNYTVPDDVELDLADVIWRGSRAEVHGKRDTGFIIDGAVIDGCVMIFRKDVLQKIGFKHNYPMHHFYDRAMSVQVREAGYKVAILGLEVDHISGQTANHEGGYHEQAKKWAFEKWGITEPQQWAELEENKAWFSNPTNPSKGNVPSGWDHVVYLTAEKLFLEEYRDQKHIIPINN